jgi:hypothetical protein
MRAHGPPLVVAVFIDAIRTQPQLMADVAAQLRTCWRRATRHQRTSRGCWLKAGIGAAQALGGWFLFCKPLVGGGFQPELFVSEEMTFKRLKIPNSRANGWSSSIAISRPSGGKSGSIRRGNTSVLS